MEENRRGRAASVLLALAKAGCYLLLFVGSQVLVSIVVSVAMAILAALGGGISPEVLQEELMGSISLLTFLSSLLTLLVLVIFFLIRKRNPLREAGLTLCPLPPVAAAAALAPAFYVAVGIVMSFFPPSMLEDYTQASSTLANADFWTFLASVIAAPLVEEVIFRGLIQSRLTRAFPHWVAGLVSALLFGICHGQIIWLIYAFLMGFLFSRIRMATGSILPCIAAHFVFNLIGFLATALESFLSVERLSGGLMAFALAGLIITRRQLPYLFGFGAGRVSGKGGNSP